MDPFEGLFDSGDVLERVGIDVTAQARRGDLEPVRCRDAEIARFLASSGAALDERQREGIERLTRTIVNKILHAPITKLRESSRAGAGRSWTELVHELFGLRNS